MQIMGIWVLSSKASFIIVIFCSRDGVLEDEVTEGGPMGGNGLDDIVTRLGL
jgi:hypothetical protein